MKTDSFSSVLSTVHASPVKNTSETHLFTNATSRGKIFDSAVIGSFVNDDGDGSENGTI